MSRKGTQLPLFSLKRPRKARLAKRRAAGSANANANANALYLPHVAREAHDARHPVHVTIRRVEQGPNFRQQRVCAAIRQVIEKAKRDGARVLHYSVQVNHLHLMVEGTSSADLSNQMRTLFSRIAFAVNAVARRAGRLFRDRHHRHALKRPSEVRNALVYILFNDRKHQAQLAMMRERAKASGVGAFAGASPAARTSHTARAVAPTLDPCSSAWWFEDWAPDDRPPIEREPIDIVRPTTEPQTWLARWGWHRGDESCLLRFSEMPRTSLAR